MDLQAGLLHQTGNIDKGFAVFMGGRGVHDDQTCAILGVNPEISPKTGICRGWAQSFCHQLLLGRNALKPSLEGEFNLIDSQIGGEFIDRENGFGFDGRIGKESIIRASRPRFHNLDGNVDIRELPWGRFWMKS